MRTTLIGWLAVGCFGVASVAWGRTSNGNDFALYVSEAPAGSPERKEIVDEALTRPHSFRYLQIMEMKRETKDGRKAIKIIAFEPASLMDVRFTVEKMVSLKKLIEKPTSQAGDAIAVTGRVQQVDDKKNTIYLSDVIIRHKDRLSPAVGKELVAEVDPGATFYSYTGGKTPVSLTYIDRDLLQHKDRVLKAEGKDGWAEYLRTKLAERKAARAAAEKESP